MHIGQEPPDRDSLSFFARRYVWWKTVEDALAEPQRIIAQVMNIGDFDDMAHLEAMVGTDMLRSVLANAEAGQFTPRSWSYWHYRLNAVAIDEVPEMQVRRLG